MNTVRLKLGNRSYGIDIGSGLLYRLGAFLRTVAPSKRAVVISDRTVFGYYGDRAKAALKRGGYEVYSHVIKPGDASKSLKVAAAVYDTLYEARAERSDPLVAVGGGVVGDLTGFIAATWLRGVPFVQVPTTLEADIDASVGGKTAVNHPKGKNLIGMFYQPRMVLMDVETLRTLSKRDVRAGLAESIKHAMIRDAGLFRYHEKEVDRILGLDRTVLERLLTKNCRIKVDVVSRDEREGGLRAILNFGHTVGHAIETVDGYGRWRHGEAVALGMVAAGIIAVERGTFSEKEFTRMERLIERFELPTRCKNLNFDTLFNLMQRDKKIKAGKIRFVLPKKIGTMEIVDDVRDRQIEKAVEYLTKC